MSNVLQHQEVVGSYVVYDPTGRDLRSCYEVGRVDSVRWDDADDGNPNGSPRPLLTVIPNGGNADDAIAVTVVVAVLPR